MESSPLTLAYEHAKAASIATQTSNTTVAINEHALAAGEFAKAAAGTGSEEALRTLKLLEQHHHRLSQLLKFPHENPVIESGEEKTVSTSAAVAELRHVKDEARPTSPRPMPLTSSTMQIPRRMPPRDMSSSIASNLASARGIRASHDRRAHSPSVNTRKTSGGPEAPQRRSGSAGPQEPTMLEHPQGKPSWVPPVHNQRPKSDAQVATSKMSAVAEPAQSTEKDQKFNAFYSTIENLFSKISAPLVFAGLPLISEEASASTEVEPASPKSKKQPPTRPSATEPDLSKYISRAALRASPHSNPGSDSFYVVPTTGHTVSYAGILSFEKKEKRRLAESAYHENPDLFEDPDNDDFVDASETPLKLSPVSNRKTQTGSLNIKGGNDLRNVVEELHTENKSLKDMIDKLSKRLHAFEVHAQNTTLALHESVRLMRSNSPAPQQAIASTGNETDKKLASRIKTLEEQLSSTGDDMHKLQRENEKLKVVLQKYRDRWERLKEGAKKRQESGNTDGQGGDGKDAEVGRIPAG